uniref:Fe2OG dioxygenase domain-containing protein n=1 Tax=Acrobeloides nanus TaxID=290746 RepID=A0A914CFD5_9BILA
MQQLYSTSMEILEILAEELNINKEWFLQQHVIDERPNYTTLRLLHYPSVPEDMPTGTERCGDHTDYGTITLLFQDEVGGLEVMNRAGEFVFVEPIKHAILLNTGDLLERWSGGINKATRHRVRAPADPKLRKQIRQSIAYFVHPLHRTIVEPLAGEKDLYSSVNAGDFVADIFARTY